MSTRSLVVVFEYEHMQPPPPSLPRTYFHISPTLTHAQYTHITAPYPTLCIVINRKKGELHNNKKEKAHRPVDRVPANGQKGESLRRRRRRERRERRERTAPCSCYPACARGRDPVLFCSVPSLFPFPQRKTEKKQKRREKQKRWSVLDYIRVNT